ncbi:hypothetical protein Tco_0944969 [Tanacetum coccineum]
MEQYLARVQDDIRPGVVKPKIGNDVEFEINSNFMRELRRKLFKGTNDEVAHELVRRVLEIADLFHFPSVTHDVVMLRVFPITLKGPALRWINRLSAGEFQNLRRDALNRGVYLTVEQNKYMRSMEETIIKFCEVLIKEEAANDEWIRKFIENTDSNIRSLKTTTKNLQKKTYHLTQTVLINTGEKVKTRKTMGKENVKEPVPRDLPVVQTCAPPSKFLGSPSRTYETIYMMGIPEEIHKVKAQEDEGNTDGSWDITVKNVDRFRQILTPTIHTLSNLKPMVQSYVTQGPVHNKEKVVREKEQDYNIPLQDNIMQPLTPQTVHITPPDDNYVTPATNPILNKNKFMEEFANNTGISEKIDRNHVNDLKELLKKYDFVTFIRELLHQLS